MRETTNPSGPTAGTEVIHAWLDDLMASIDRGERVETAAGAQPRSYAYLAFSGPDDRHSVLLFSVEMGEGEPVIVARKIDGSGERVQSELEALKKPVYFDG